MTAVSGKTILLIIGGGIAAYKSLELIRLLTGKGVGVRSIMTRAAEEFVTPLSVASLTKQKVHTALFNLTDEIEMGHIELSRAVDLLVVAPATADLMAKMAHGNANDLASTTLLATDKPVLIAPAMNVRMWHHAATQRNLLQLKRDGILFVGPNEGDMACGEYGLGRMAEPAEIVAAIEAALAPKAQPLKGKKVLITAGPTREAIDPVRYISNYSSGKQGYAIAAAAVALGAETVLISGPVDLPIPPGVQMIPVTSAVEMLAASERELPVTLPFSRRRLPIGAWRRRKLRRSRRTRAAFLISNLWRIQTSCKPSPSAPQSGQSWLWALRRKRKISWRMPARN